MLVRLQDGRLKDVDVTEVTKDNYIVPQNERNVYHCKIEITQFDNRNGKKISRPRIQKFDKKEYETIVERNLKLQGYVVEVLYNPTEYLQSVKKQRAGIANGIQHANSQAEIDAAVAKALAQQKAAFDKQLEEAVAKAMAKQNKGKK